MDVLLNIVYEDNIFHQHINKTNGNSTVWTFVYV